MGIRTYTRKLREGDRLVVDDEIVVNADTDLDCPQLDNDDPDPDPPDDRQAISWIAFCQSNGSIQADDVSVSAVDTDEDGDPLSASWSSSVSVDNVVVFGASRLFTNVDSGTGGTVELGQGEEVEWGRGTEQRPPSPCRDGECGPKFDWDGGSFTPAGHQDECVE